MSLTLEPDSQKPNGYAILRGPGLAGVDLLSIENCFSPGLFLGEDGRWGKVRFACPVEPIDGQRDAVSLGPHIVDFIQTDLQIAFRNPAGELLGRVFWSDVNPSPNPGRITSADVLRVRKPGELENEREREEERKREEQRKLEEQRKRDEQQRLEDQRKRDEQIKREQQRALDRKRERAERRDFPVRLVATCALALALVIAAVLLWPRPKPPIPPKPVDDHGTHETPPPPLPHPEPQPQPHPPPHPPTPPRPPRPRPNACPQDVEQAYQAGLAKSTSDDIGDLTESERLLTCALQAGKAEARHQLGRLHVKMATAVSRPLAEELQYYQRACDEGDQEGCDKANLRLDR